MKDPLFDIIDPVVLIFPEAVIWESVKIAPLALIAVGDDPSTCKAGPGFIVIISLPSPSVVNPVDVNFLTFTGPNASIPPVKDPVPLELMLPEAVTGLFN